jgi:hypothetical protein
LVNEFGLFNVFFRLFACTPAAFSCGQVPDHDKSLQVYGIFALSTNRHEIAVA